MLPRLKAGAQNLVPNGGFEIYNQHPTDQGMISFSTTWLKFSKTGADFYHAESYMPKRDKIHPLNGKAFAGLFILYPGTNPSLSIKSELISSKLLSKLITDQEYYIELYVSISDEYNLYGLSINNISAVFTTESIEGLSNKKVEEIIKNSKTRFDNKSINISIKNEWIKISGNFTAKGGEQYMTIGNFDLLNDIIYVRTDGESKKIIVPDYKRFYFYIDEIKVVPIDENDNEIKWRKDSVEITCNFEKNKPYQINNIHFETGSSLLQVSSFIALDSLFNQQNRSTSAEDSIIISGHTDSEGDEEDNLKLSEARAKVVADYLITKGFERERIKYIGFGSSQSIATNETNEGREQNRRVEFIIKTKKD